MNSVQSNNSNHEVEENRANEKTLINNKSTLSTIVQGNPEHGCISVRKSNRLQYINEFYVPENLWLEKLLKWNGFDFWLKRERLQKLLFIVSFIQYAYLDFKRAGVKRNGYVGIHKKVLARHVGNQPTNGKAFYVRALNVLEELGVIEVNRKYRATTKQGDGFTKSYRLGKKYWNEEPRIIRFHQRRPPLIRDQSEITNDVQQFIYSNIKQLVLDELALKQSLSNCTDIKTEILIRKNAQQFRGGAINLRGGRNQRRLYHRLTSCPTEMRPLFRLKGESLSEYDIPHCFSISAGSSLNGRISITVST